MTSQVVSIYAPKRGLGNKFLIMEDKKRRPWPVTRFECPFEVVIKHNPEMNVWYVYKYIDTHNHVMARSNEVGFLLSHRRISDRQKKKKS